MAFRFLVLTLTVYATFLSTPTSAQIPTPPCTPAMITNFAPCVNFISNSSLNATTPTSACCNSLSSLMSSGKDCFCLIATGSVPFQIPINRTLAISLPRACNMPGVPLQCKAAGAPAPAPGLVANGPAVSPNVAPSPGVQALAPTEPLAPRSSPAADVTPVTPTNGGGATPSNTGSRAGVTPSSAHISYSFSPLVLVAVFGAFVLKYC